MIKSILLFFLLLGCIITNAQITGSKVTVYDSTATTGYYFISSGNTFYILDRFGEVVYYKPQAKGINFMLQANGFTTITDDRYSYLMDSLFNIVDSFTCKGFLNDLHDMELLPNGHALMIGRATNVLDWSKFSIKGRTGTDTTKVICYSVQEQDANKNIVFQWNDKDHFAYDDADTFFLGFQAPNEPRDWSHINAVTMDDDGNILISFRNLNEVTKVNHADGSIMWRMGGKRNEFKFIDLPEAKRQTAFLPFNGQHDIRRISNGHITLLDNGSGEVPHSARALELALDEKEKIATVVWSYEFDSLVVTKGRGNVQRLPNGNTLICYGNVIGHKGVCFVVVDPTGRKIFKFSGLKNIFKTYNYPDLPWQIHRPQITCFDSAGITYLDAGPGYRSYKWSNSKTDRRIAIQAAGTYAVMVPYGSGAFVRSDNIEIKSIKNPCPAGK